MPSSLVDCEYSFIHVFARMAASEADRLRIRLPNQSEFTHTVDLGGVKDEFIPASLGIEPGNA